MQLAAFSGQALPPSEPAHATVASPSSTAQYVQPSCLSHQVQVATQTTTDKKGTGTSSSTGSGPGAGTGSVGKGKKNRYQFQQRQSQNQQVQQNAATFGSQNIAQQNYQIDPNTGWYLQEMEYKAISGKVEIIDDVCLIMHVYGL
jgi:hypothetical protein